MNRQFVSRLEKAEARCQKSIHPPLVIVAQFEDGHCEANGQHYQSLQAVKACFPLSLLIVGKEPAPTQ